MKTVTLLFFGLSFSLVGLEWQSYDEALKKQQKNHKLIMIDTVRTGCRYCDNMDKEVFQEANMSAWIEERFIPVKINITTQKLPLGLKTSFTPTFYFIDSRQNVVKTIAGAWSSEDFKSLTEKLK
jgi:thioredoxin-related protein